MSIESVCFLFFFYLKVLPIISVSSKKVKGALLLIGVPIDNLRDKKLDSKVERVQYT